MTDKNNLPKQLSLFNLNSTNIEDLATPKGYKGIAAFHKYWGKKPIECLSFLIESLTTENDIILDPFLGSGLVARESISRKRRFIGIDINPISVELAKMLIDLPSHLHLREILSSFEENIKPKIEATYTLDDGNIASHYLWEEEKIKSVWTIAKGGRKREERIPTEYDYNLIEQFQNYQPKIPREINLFQNSRINTKDNFKLTDLLTCRALHNIDILLEAINQQDNELKKALLLSLTSASGQMSKMVFAITGRGKNKNQPTKKIEVGSWVIGYWRPTLHFEINVWNCFERRVKKLIKAIDEIDDINTSNLSGKLIDVVNYKANVAIVEGDNRKVLSECPDEIISLIVADPPHSDRIPYLELSEMWNSLIGKKPNFSDEIVISNAVIRGKDRKTYIKEMGIFFDNTARILKPGGILALFFNSKDREIWNFLNQIILSSTEINFRGYFPMKYSSNSVLQNNRTGSLKHDFVLIYQKSGKRSSEFFQSLIVIPGWRSEFPNYADN